MNEIKIEKNIPLPVSYMKADVKYPFDDMEKGDSFFVSFEENLTLEEKRKIANSVSSSCHSWKKNRKVVDKSFITRTTKEGVRCWRSN